jgi:hypothetical protein
MLARRLIASGDSFDRCLANFLDEFKVAPSTEAAHARAFDRRALRRGPDGAAFMLRACPKPC